MGEEAGFSAQADFAVSPGEGYEQAAGLSQASPGIVYGFESTGSKLDYATYQTSADPMAISESWPGGNHENGIGSASGSESTQDGLFGGLPHRDTTPDTWHADPSPERPKNYSFYDFIAEAGRTALNTDAANGENWIFGASEAAAATSGWNKLGFLGSIGLSPALNPTSPGELSDMFIDVVRSIPGIGGILAPYGPDHDAYPVEPVLDPPGFYRPPEQ